MKKKRNFKTELPRKHLSLLRRASHLLKSSVLLGHVWTIKKMLIENLLLSFESKVWQGLLHKERANASAITFTHVHKRPPSPVLIYSSKEWTMNRFGEWKCGIYWNKSLQGSLWHFKEKVSPTCSVSPLFCFCFSFPNRPYKSAQPLVVSLTPSPSGFYEKMLMGNWMIMNTLLYKKRFIHDPVCMCMYMCATVKAGTDTHSHSVWLAILD